MPDPMTPERLEEIQHFFATNDVPARVLIETGEIGHYCRQANEHSAELIAEVRRLREALAFVQERAEMLRHSIPKQAGSASTSDSAMRDIEGIQVMEAIARQALEGAPPEQC